MVLTLLLSGLICAALTYLTVYFVDRQQGMHVKNSQNFVLFHLELPQQNCHQFKNLLPKHFFLKSGRFLIDLSLLSNFSQTFDILFDILKSNSSSKS